LCRLLPLLRNGTSLFGFSLGVGGFLDDYLGIIRCEFGGDSTL
jgi:hypothetical protein